MAGEAGKPGNSPAETIFTAALALSQQDRAAYLARACGDNDKLRQRVEALLHAHEAPAGFLPEQPSAASGSADHLVSIASQAVAVTEQPGDTIGRYKLLQKIGEGGCGVVYMAEQEEPVRRKVALKVIKLGMDTKQVVARFEAERQVLAMMDHASIAKVLDAGATETGRPYFVMELVGGIKITDYCDQNNLTTCERLDLFMQVCRAIQHAHHKGIIHRDIKPSNVLVALQDGVPVPKVIDFGIAKATQGRLTDDTVFTAFEQFLGTPAYMSPEQAQLGGLDVDTRSDIYSLGVLLYELLTGKTPFDAKELLGMGLEATRRTIQEKEPPTPSTRLKQQLAAQQAQNSGQSKIKNQKSRIEPDLDWIVMKCLEKERARRYETANGLARDIERHLNNEAVAAGPPSNFYRFQKLVRRNKGAFAAVAVAAVVLMLGLAMSTWQAVRATRAEQRSTREASKSQQVAQFLKDMLAGVGPSKALGRDTAMLREILDKTAERIGKELTNQPEVQIELRATLATTYRDLGFYQKMKESAEANLSLARSCFGPEHLTVAESLFQLGIALGELGDYGEAESQYRKALALRRKLLGKEHLLVANTLEGLALLIRRGSLLAKVSRLAEAEAISREALSMQRKLLGNEHRAVARSLDTLVSVLNDERKLDEAEALAREALAMQEKLLGKEHPEVANSLENLGRVLQLEDKLEDAERIFREELGLRRRLMGNDHPAVAYSLHSVANVLIEEGRAAEAEVLEREALAVQRRALGDQNPFLIYMIDNLALTLMNQGKLAEAEANEREALAIHRKTPGNIDRTLANLAQLLRGQGKFAEAEIFLQECVARQRERQSPDLDWTLGQLADALLNQKKFKEAEPVTRECLAIREKNSPDSWRAFNMRKLLGEALLGQQKHDEAEPVLLSAYEGLKKREEKIPMDSRRWVKDSIQDIVRLYEATGRSDKVAEWKMELTGWYRKLLAQYRKAAESSNPQALNDIAWFLATCGDASVRDGPGAVAYAEKAVAATNRKDPGFLDTLAATYAEAGEFAKAISTQREGMELLHDESAKNDFATRLKLYESNTPYRDSAL